MKVVIATDSFKGSLSSIEVSDAIARGIHIVDDTIEIIKVPMADGGEGTVEALVTATGGRYIKDTVTGPLGHKVEARFGILGDQNTAIIEMASASGLPLVPENMRNPLITTTYGTGELIQRALDCGCREIIIGIGGSATNDGGAGMAQALGAKLLDNQGQAIGYGGSELEKLQRIDISSLDLRIKSCRFIVACDVDNPLCGTHGASYVYGPQKGATYEMIQVLDQNLEAYAQVIKRDLDKEVKDIKGAGAAGGLGAGLLAFLDADLLPGVNIVIEKTGLKQILKDADLVITGEGQLDGQTIYGKTPTGVAKAAKAYHIPVIALAGSVTEDSPINHSYGIDAMFSIINYPISLEKALEKERAEGLIEKNTEELFRLIKVLEYGKNINR